MTVNDAMRRAAQAHARGDLAGALRDSETALRMAPRNPAILQFVGVILCQSGQPDKGLARFKQALAIQPRDPGLLFNAAKAGLDAGDLAAARTYAAPLGGQADGQRLLAEIASRGEDFGEAARLYEGLARAQPGNHEVLNNYGNALNQAGRPADALPVLERAQRLAPASAPILLNIGRALAAQQRYAEAIDRFRQAAAMPGLDADLRYELGQTLLRYGLHEEAIGQLGEAARLGRKEAQTFVAIGVCFFAIEDRDKAETAFRMALSIDKRSERAALNLAMLFERENRVDDLRSLLEQVRSDVKPGPDRDFIEALVLRRDNDFEAALSLAERSASDSIDPTTRAQFIGQVADRLGLYDRAFAAFDDMNTAARNSPDAAMFELGGYPNLVDDNTRVVTPAWFASWSDIPITDARPSPAFLGGFLRSGTTLLDTIIMGHPDTVVREEEPMLARLEDAGGPIASLPGKTASDVQAMRDAYFAEARARGDLPAGKLLVDKYPLMTLRASYIHRAFPDAKFIFALRHPCDVVLSCWMQNFRATMAMAAFLTLESAARLYDAAMTHWMRCRDVMPLQVHTVRYEAMVDDLEGELRPMMDFLGLEWDDQLLAYQKTARDRGYIRTPSYAQVTEGIYRRSAGRWENYREHFGAALPILEPWIERWGYA